MNTLLPDFNNLHLDTVVTDLDSLLATNCKKVDALLTQEEFTWDNLMRPLELIGETLQQMFSPIEELNAVMNSPKLREIYNECLPKLTAYHTQLSQNETLYRAIKQIASNDEFELLSPAQKQIIKNALRDFKLSGVDLPQAKKDELAKLEKHHAELTTKFEENLLDATTHWFYHTQNEKELSGLPAWLITGAKQLAQQEKKSGWQLSLDFPIYYAVITQADDPTLRERFYRAFCTRASDLGENKDWDNSQIMLDILQVRHEMAQLLGFQNYAILSLETKMAENPAEVLHFLTHLAQHAKPYAEKELRELNDFAKAQYGIEQLNPWDIAYYSEKLQEKAYAISQEKLRPYFPEPKVWQGLAHIVQKIYKIEIKPIPADSTWHPDVKLYAIQNISGNVLGYFYTDLYARANKRGGAWVGECRNRYYLEDGSLQLPVAYLNCNFAPPDQGNPCLMTHDDVITLFHEFGHTLHHLLSNVDYAAVSGFNGVAWDAVELPSQFMENFCWQEDVIPLISGHAQTGEPLPAETLKQLIAAKNFQIGLQMVRQLEFSLFDFRLHREFKIDQPTQIQDLLNEVRKEVAVIIPPSFNRFQHGFAHIFAGGYAAGYYSYKWAEVLSSDAFARFEEEGIFNPITGHDFLRCILQQGGSQDAMELFKQFRGRAPEIKHLLKHSGMEST